MTRQSQIQVLSNCNLTSVQVSNRRDKLLPIYKIKNKNKNKQTKIITADAVNTLLCSLAVEQHKFAITKGYTNIHLSFIENKSNYPFFACGYPQ